MISLMPNHSCFSNVQIEKQKRKNGEIAAICVKGGQMEMH